jgi:hypothetical protein
MAAYNNRGGVTIREEYGHCYVAIVLARMLWRHSTIEEVMQVVFSVGPLRCYITRPTEFSLDSERSEVERAVA